MKIINEIKSIIHPLEPIYDRNSKVLILGTMPSPKSRENRFYYTHPQNRFWRVLSDLFTSALPKSNEERVKLLYTKGIAMWDVLASCEISGASDSSIKKPVPNDISIILKAADIKAIFTTGKKAAELYKNLIYPKIHIEAIILPSTSPANCQCTYTELLEAYSEMLEYTL